MAGNEYVPSYASFARTVEHGRRQIALQFPDELLHASVPVFRALKRRIGKDQELYVLADTSYSSCCVDEVAASHVDAEAVVHYGRACLTRYVVLSLFMNPCPLYDMSFPLLRSSSGEHVLTLR